MRKMKQMAAGLIAVLCLTACAACGTSGAETKEETGSAETTATTEAAAEKQVIKGKKNAVQEEPSKENASEEAAAEGTTDTIDTTQSGDTDEGEYTVTIPVLTCGGLPFTHMKNLCTANNPDGGYYYVDMAEDGTVCVYNHAYASLLGDYQGDILAYMTWAGPSLGPDGARDIVVKENQTYSEKMGCPVYIITFTTGTNEDTRYWTAYAAEAYGYTYLYEFSVWAEESDGMAEIIQDIFDELYLMEI